MNEQEFRCPRHLVEEILTGNCVAFVGAGFSAAAELPDWPKLLCNLAEDDAALCEQIERALRDYGGADGRYFAAQLLEDHLGRARLIAGLRRELCDPQREIGATMRQRLHWLHRIPFRAVLTTNFDNLLDGPVAGEDSYVEALRPERHRWWEQQFWRELGGPKVLKLHGDLQHADADARRDHVVLTRRDYRRRLYQDAGYQSFLRNILATRTLVYLGFSFTDAYISELRSEVLSLLDHRQSSPPVAYAVIADAPADLGEFYRKHEGIAVLGYGTRTHAGRRDFSGFDRWLEAIYEATSPRRRFARLFAGKRVLWLDPHPGNNEEAHQFFAAIGDEPLTFPDGGKQAPAPIEVVHAATAEQARDLLRARSFDLVISHWGEDQRREHAGDLLANGPRLLKYMRSEDLRAPVVVFASRRDVAERKRLVLSMGARAYCYTFQALFREIDAIVDEAAG